MKSVGKVIIVSAVACACHPVFGSQVLFSNFGPGDTYLTGFAGPIYGQGPAAHIVSAASFTSAHSAKLTRIELPLYRGPGGPTDTIMRLHSSIGGEPGTVLEQWQFLVTGFDIRQIDSVLMPNLIAGEEYWISLTSDGPYGHWKHNAIGQVGMIYSADGGPWQYSPIFTSAFRVTGEAAIPGPAAALPFLAMVVARRLRRA
jgi:hypothetical protein